MLGKHHGLMVFACQPFVILLSRVVCRCSFIHKHKLGETCTANLACQTCIWCPVASLRHCMGGCYECY